MKSKQRQYTVVGRLCNSRGEAVEWLKEIRTGLAGAIDPREAWSWGVMPVSKVAPTLRLPVAPELLLKLEGLLSDVEVQKTAKGRAALKLVRKARGR